MADSQFTSTALGAIRLAQENAARLGHSYVGSEHLLLGLAGQEFSPASMALRRAGADSRSLRSAIVQRVGTGVPARSIHQGLTPNCCMAIQGAVEESRRLGGGAVNSEHLLLGLLRTKGSGAARLLAHCGVEAEGLYRTVSASLGGEEAPTPKPRTREPEARSNGDTRQLDQCARDLTRMAGGGPAGSGDRPEGGAGAPDSDTVPADQEQPRPDRGAGRGQDRRGGGAGRCHCRRKRPPAPAGQANLCPGFVRHGGGHKVSGGI